MKLTKKHFVTLAIVATITAISLSTATVAPAEGLQPHKNYNHVSVSNHSLQRVYYMVWISGDTEWSDEKSVRVDRYIHLNVPKGKSLWRAYWNLHEWDVIKLPLNERYKFMNHSQEYTHFDLVGHEYDDFVSMYYHNH